MLNENTEFVRQKRVICMMITAHSIMRDRYSRISTIFDIALLIASVFLNALVFVSDDFFVSLGVNPANGKLFLGIISVIVFALAVVGILLNTKQKSENHSQACTQYFYLLNEVRAIDEIQEETEKNTRISLFASKYSQITGVLIPIPDKNFNKLKSRHLRKVEFSKFISKHPDKNYFLQRYLFFKQSLKK